MGTFFREEVAEPLNADFHVGFGPALDQRVGQMIPAPVAGGVEMPPDSILMRVMMNPMLDLAECNTRAWRACEIPAANGHGNARSCARIMSALACGGEVDGVRLIARRRSTVRSQSSATGRTWCWACRCAGDLVSCWRVRICRSGLMHVCLATGVRAGRLQSQTSMRVRAWGYVMNRMDSTTTGDRRGSDLAAAFYKAL